MWSLGYSQHLKQYTFTSLFSHMATLPHTSTPHRATLQHLYTSLPHHHRATPPHDTKLYHATRPLPSPLYNHTSPYPTTPHYYVTSIPHQHVIIPPPHRHLNTLQPLRVILQLLLLTRSMPAEFRSILAHFPLSFGIRPAVNDDRTLHGHAARGPRERGGKKDTKRLT